MDDKCLNLSVIPQFGGSCWFNAILTIALYSQNTRKILLKVASKWKKPNTFQQIIKSILVKYYREPSKVQSFFSKIRPETILFKMLKTYNETEMIKILKFQMKLNKANIAWTENYIVKFFKYLNVNCLDIIYLNNGRYILNFDDEISPIFDINSGETLAEFKYKNETKEESDRRIFKSTYNILKKIPDIIFLFHEDLSIYTDTNYSLLKVHKSSMLDHFKYKCKIKGANTYDDIIYVNGHKYKLDACTLTNFNEVSTAHAIAGISCNNERYVYNGWQKSTNDPAMQNYTFTSIADSPCQLMKFNWDLKKDIEFCLNKDKCKLDLTQLNDYYSKLCFSFGKHNKKGRRILVYVRVKETENIKSKDIGKDISIPSKLKISGLSEIIKDIHDIKQLSDIDLVIELNNFGIYPIPDYHYSRELLESMYYDALKEYYNLTSSIVQSLKKRGKLPSKSEIKKYKEEKETKEKIIKKILDKYPELKDSKSLKYKNKKELLAIYDKGYKNIKVKKHQTKDELITFLIKKIPKLNKTTLEKLTSILLQDHK